MAEYKVGQIVMTLGDSKKRWRRATIEHTTGGVGSTIVYAMEYDGVIRSYSSWDRSVRPIDEFDYPTVVLVSGLAKWP